MSNTDHQAKLSHPADPPQEKKKPGWRRDLYDWLQLLALVLVGVTTFFTFFGMIFGVSGSSMYPTLHPSDAMFIQRVGYTPKQGDIIVLKKDGFPYPDDSEAIVKRVIAVEGQDVEIDYHTNSVYVDGVLLEEDYLNFANEGVEEYEDDYMVKRSGMTDFDQDGDTEVDDFTVPEGCIFVMGDNRNGSTDSRYAELGMVDTRYVIGRALFVFFPIGNAKWLTH